jgi:hypothetical protein
MQRPHYSTYRFFRSDINSAALAERSDRHGIVVSYAAKRKREPTCMGERGKHVHAFGEF